MYSVRLIGVSKRYPERDHDALRDLDLVVDGEEFVSIVGPSGCGKSTALRIIAGLEDPTDGTVQLGGVDITGLETRRRHVGLVTQQNQLVNHRTAGDNIRFPLEVRPSPGPLGRSLPDDRHAPGRMVERVTEEATRFGITDLLERRPKTLSEGQRRLVQLARAVIASPSTLLMDEPLGYLEDQVRLKLRTEIKRVHHERRLTSVMATASQQDAMVMSDRIAVIIDGALQQYGTPDEIYETPGNIDVATFFGEPVMNVFAAVARVESGHRLVDVLGLRMRVQPDVIDRFRDLPITVGVRPEDVELGVPQDQGVPATVETTELLGHSSSVWLRTAGGERIACTIAGIPPRPGTVVDVGFAAERIHLFDPLSGRAVHHPARR